MQIKPIKNDSDHRAALARIEELWDAQLNTPEGAELEVLIKLVKKYEEAHFPIEVRPPIDANEFHTEQR